MICPKCGADGCRYVQKREDFSKTKEKRFKRTNFNAKCKKCGFEGEVY